MRGARLAMVAAALVAIAVPAPAAADFGVLGEFTLSNTPDGPGYGFPRIAADGAGNVYLLRGRWIQKYDAGGVLVGAFGGPGAGDGQFAAANNADSPTDIATDSAGNVYVADAASNRIVKFASDGSYLARFGRNGGDGSAGTAAGEFDYPANVAVDAQGNMFVRDVPRYRSGTGSPPPRIQKLSPAGAPLASVPAYGTGAIAVTPDGDLLERLFLYETTIMRRDRSTLAVVDVTRLPRDHPGPPPRSGEADSCCGLVAAGQSFWVGRDTSRQVERYSLDGRLLYACGVPEPPGYSYVGGQLASGAGGSLYVARETVVEKLGEGGTSCDPEPPRITGVALSATRFRASSWRALKRVRLTYRLSKRASVTARVLQRITGRLVDAECHRVSRGNRGLAHCARKPRTRARLSGLPNYAQENSYRLVNGLWRAPLPAGRYFLVLSATDRAGRKSAETVLRFRVLR